MWDIIDLFKLLEIDIFKLRVFEILFKIYEVIMYDWDKKV